MARYYIHKHEPVLIIFGRNVTEKISNQQEAQLSPSDRAMRFVSSNLANYHATVQKLLTRQVLTRPMV